MKSLRPEETTSSAGEVTTLRGSGEQFPPRAKADPEKVVDLRSGVEGLADQVKQQSTSKAKLPGTTLIGRLLKPTHLSAAEEQEEERWLAHAKETSLMIGLGLPRQRRAPTPGLEIIGDRAPRKPAPSSSVSSRPAPSARSHESLKNAVDAAAYGIAGYEVTKFVMNRL